MKREEAKHLLQWNIDYNESIEYNESIIDEVFDDFESRVCENCKYFIWNDRYVTDYGTCEKGIGITFRGDCEVNKDFGCNKFISKLL